MAGARAGTIRRIALENFVTYTQVELFPGPNLNMIIGPNGTGKSTFICAIVLGLCGKTNVIGRAKKISDFIRSGCQEATIEIDLCTDDNGATVTITRNFNMENSSVWSIDKKPIKEKGVHNLISSLNIRVDNLCQLLPQDRVQDFAKMNPQELLRSTQLAVSGEESVVLLDELLECKVNHRKLVAKLESNSRSLVEKEQSTARAKAIIASMEEEKKIKEEVELCKKKKLWIEYKEINEVVENLAKDKESVLKEKVALEKPMAPIKLALERLEATSKSLNKQTETARTTCENMKSSINNLLKEPELYNAKIEDIQSNLKDKIAKQINTKRDLEQANASLTKMFNDKVDIIKTYGDEISLRNKVKFLCQPIKNLDDKIAELNKSRTELKYEIDNGIAPQIRQFQSKLVELKDGNNKRLEMLRNVNEHTYKALLWLRENKDMFRHAVYEPMFLEINFTDSKFAKYLENTVPFKDLIAFTFEDTNDMNLFLKIVRQELKLKLVNAICSRPTNRVFQPGFDINNLRHLGFYTILRDVVTGPDAIMNYLCVLYNIHRIPIGDKTTFYNSEKVPRDINFFYSDNYKFNIHVSRHSGEKATSTNEIRQANLLGNITDQEKIDIVETQLERLNARNQSLINNIKQVDKDIAQHEKELNNLYNQRNTLQEYLNRLTTILSRIKSQQNKVLAIKNQPYFNVEAEKIKADVEIKTCIKNECTFQKQIFDSFTKLQNHYIMIDLLGIKCNILYRSIQLKNEKLKELKNNSLKVEQTLEMISNNLLRQKIIAKEKFKEAKASTNNKYPDETDFPYKKQFLHLPKTINDLQELIETLNTKLNVRDSGDDQAIIEYKNLQKAIDELQADNSSIKKQVDVLDNRMKALKDDWLTPLESQISKIGNKFGDMFAQMGCAGEVRLMKSGADDDYDKYGICIMVKFREKEQLQQLTSQVQSGGERALATALYLMALQQLSKAPFRCVDEINQGMDPINERKMFQLLIKIMTECDKSSQYFLLTPKLLSGLEYTPLMNIHTIYNGAQVVKYSKWNLNKFIERAKRQ